MFLLLFLCGTGAILLQMILPKLPFAEIHPFVVVLPVLYAAMRFSGPGPLGLALLLGAMIDILSPQKFGTGCVVLSVIVGMAWMQRENLPFGHWGTILLLALTSTFIALVVDYAFFCWESGNWSWHFTLWVRMAWVALLNMVLALPFFWVIDLFTALRRRPEGKNYAL